MPIHDISAPLRPDLPSWPGEEGLRRCVLSDVAVGDGATVSELTLGSHTGTHIDAPSHFLEDGGGIDSLELDALVGRAYVAALATEGTHATAADLDAAGVPEAVERLLLRTRSSGWSALETEFREDFVGLDVDAARWCVERGLRLVGIDYLSIEPYGAGEADHAGHRALLGARVVILEGLDLAAIEPGWYRLAALPLLIPGGDGAPARAVLIEE
jgi:arylformamidase